MCHIKRQTSSIAISSAPRIKLLKQTVLFFFPESPASKIHFCLQKMEKEKDWLIKLNLKKSTLPQNDHHKSHEIRQVHNFGKKMGFDCFNLAIMDTQEFNVR